MASFKFKNIYLGSSSTISSTNEKINTKFILTDYYEGEKNIENTQVNMIEKVLNDITKESNPNFIIGSDLSNQLGITSVALKSFPISYLGIYSACASYIEGLIVGASLLSGSNLKEGIILTSSHNLSAERTFRYPIEYGTPRKITQTFTATGAVASILTKTETDVLIESATIGKIVDYGIKDPNNPGAVMAPGAVDTLLMHLKEMKREINYYDLVITGDLGKLGTELFKKLLEENNIKIKNHIDAGSILITDKNLTDEGASGPVCLPLVLTEKIIKQRKYKKILLLGTGSLHNTTLVNQSKSIPTITHAVSLEVL